MYKMIGKIYMECQNKVENPYNANYNMTTQMQNINQMQNNNFVTPKMD